MTIQRFIGTFLALLSLDAASKWAALMYIPPMEWGVYPFGGIALFSNFLGISFSLNIVFNTGAAWGLFAGNAGLLFASRIVIVAALGLYIYFFQKPMVKMASLWLIATGAIGNALDYLLYGHVVDFFHFVLWGYSFPIFNLADAMITFGVAGLMLFGKSKKVLDAV